MHIKREKIIHGNFNTELYNLLNNLPEEKILYQNEHNLRHPLGIYAVSTSRVFKAFNSLVNILKEKKPDKEKLSIGHNELLDAIMAFIDDGYLIMKTFFPKSSVNKEIKFAHQWLKDIDHKIIQDHQKSIAQHRKILNLIVNKIKHNHARYCKINIDTIWGEIKGYYIEGVDDQGVVLPDTEIHPKYGSVYTAISYNKDIKRYFVDFYIFASIIANTSYKLIKKHYGIQVLPRKCEYSGDSKLLDLIKNIEEIPDLFFPDEYEIELPQILIDQEKEIIELRKTAYKSYLSKLKRYKDVKVSNVVSGDGISKSWALPYFGI